MPREKSLRIIVIYISTVIFLNIQYLQTLMELDFAHPTNIKKKNLSLKNNETTLIFKLYELSSYFSNYPDGALVIK